MEYLRIDIQLFADEEKTEKPTPKKRKEAREKGQIAQSREVNSAFVLLFVFIGMKIFGSYMFENLIKYTNKVFTYYTSIGDIYNYKGIQKIFKELLLVVAKTVAPIVLIALSIGLAASYAQVGFLFTTKTLEVKLNRLNPIEGFKRILSKRALVELLKSIIKIFVIAYIIYAYVVNHIGAVKNLFSMKIEGIVKFIADISFHIGIRAGIVLAILAILDYGYQRWENEKNLKMSKKEVKEEHKQTEGDPQIKSKIKEKQRQMAMSRMMEEVPNADVIITNPTHYAIALKYDTTVYDAPYVVAKGKDLIAQNIKKAAKEASVPIVEDKLLARTLYKSVDIGEMIPEELYQSVAEILAYVYSLQQ
ncbi:flagellar biosynthesis protein FlhB [Caldisalinibacter kiritimatiensis]|uniref:Flagellar biosynthetic protein FlhB n=1 Tax=Caldisalinibacter kiritimatiensis TaxID=1304284 RepID=R1ARD6_9FIRM|nr:flagellar biosynthesis protein FlhB [Caldisalinibacter kiritimatiensis]EOC99722.1 Flagellar biosynthesis protein FlhB [Caldisalinibacter kiritimatiensis]